MRMSGPGGPRSGKTRHWSGAPPAYLIAMTYFGLPYIHAVFDVAAWLASMTVFWLVTRHLLPAEALPANRVPHPGAYAIAAGMGALCGAMFFGTANALLSGVHALGFSMVGGIAGAIASIEAFKRFTGVSGSTGIVFAAPFAATVAVGRWGCFFSGLADFTYGTPTACPGASISATASPAIRCSSTNPSPWPRCSSC